LLFGFVLLPIKQQNFIGFTALILFLSTHHKIRFRDSLYINVLPPTARQPSHQPQGKCVANRKAEGLPTARRDRHHIEGENVAFYMAETSPYAW
jgi:hypothetical protein